MRIVLLLSCLLSSCAGCGPSTGTVSGVVSYKGKPVPGGYLTFRPLAEGANSIPYTLERDGKFQVELPVGEVLVCIDNREFAPYPAVTAPNLPGMKLPPEVMQSLQQNARASSKASDRWVELPEKYFAMESSGLKFIVEGGEQTYNVDLTD